MKIIRIFVCGMGLLAFATGTYAAEYPMGQGKKGDGYHKGMGNASGLSGYRSHFKDIDKDGNGALSWEEYSANFPNTEKKVFDILDTDKDAAVSKEEWHSFKAAHGMAGPHTGPHKGQEGKKYHDMALPDPAPYNVHFPDIDKDGDAAVTMDEFKGYFPEGDEKVFQSIDLDKNGSLSHEEWQEFKTAHGMKQ